MTLMRLLRWCALVAALLPAAAPPAAAQALASRYAGKVVQDVRLQIEGTPAVDQSLFDLLEIRRGETLAIDKVRESIQHVFSLGRFQDVQVAAEEGTDGGVVLTFNLIRVRNIERIAFRGQLGLPENLLRSTIVERYGASPSLGRLDAAAQTLQQLYADQGYLRARVQGAAETLRQPERTVLAFDIEPGPRATIDAVELAGDPRITREALLRRLQASIGAPYLRARLQTRLDEYVRRLKEQRYYEAVGSLRAIESTDGSRVSLGIAINAGPLVSVRFAGDPVPRDRLDELAPLAREGSVEEDLLEDSEGKIRAYLRHEGYWKADVTVARERTDTALTVVFTIKRGRQYRLAGPAAVSGAKAIGVAELMPLIPLKTGELFVESQLAAAADAVRAYYRERGFPKADVKFAVNELDSPPSGEGLVRPAIAIVEGPRAAVGEITITGNAAIPAGELRPLVAMATGDPYFEPKIAAARDALAVEYLNRGFAAVVVQPATRPNADATRIDLVFEIQEGPQTIVDHILIIGNEHTKAGVILRELQFRPGAPLGLQDQFESRRRLSALGLFRRVQIAGRPHGSSNEHDVLVTVEEAPATSIGYGGGFEGQQILRATGEGGVAEAHYELTPRGFFDVGRNNLFGANRSVNLFTRIGFSRRNTPDPEEETSRFGFMEYRAGATYRQPQWFGPNTLTVTGVVEQGARTSFNFARRSLIADVGRRLTPAVRISGRYALSTTRTFDEQFLSEEDQSTIDRLFPQVRLSGFAGAISHDTRDDQFDPTRGLFLSGEGTVAARALGGEVGFMKGYVEALAFRPVLGTKRVVLATRAAIGLADGFERQVEKLDASGNPIPGELESVEDLPASERFFAGGDSTIRGYALDSVGAPETISPNGFPTGGNALLLLSGELRFPVWKSIGAVAFIDGGNVFRRVTEFDASELRGAVGFGLRYRSQVGTVRVDVGFKLNRRDLRGQSDLTALHFSLGQAF
jgi:outer membrane protein insertion porin family